MSEPLISVQLNLGWRHLAALAATTALVPLALAAGGLQVFVNGTVADADAVNANFSALESALLSAQSDISTLQGSLSTVEGDVSTLQGNVSTLETDITALQGASLDGVIGGRTSWSFGSCGESIGSPCILDISRGGYTTPPACVISMTNTDATGYQEVGLIKNITTTQVQIWQGQYHTAGTTLSIAYICVPRV
jgi:hypothetical protein